MTVTPYRIELRRTRMIEERCIVDVPGHLSEADAISRAKADAEIFHLYQPHATRVVGEPFHAQIRARAVGRKTERMA